MTFLKLFQNIEREAINFVARRNKSVLVYFIKSSIILYLATIIPGYMFMVIEGQMEDEFKDHIYPKAKADIIKRMYILGHKNLDDKEYLQNAKGIIIGYETQMQQWIRDYPLIIENLDTKIWTLWNAFFYSYTVYTTLGYGDLYPITTVGKCSTIIYTLIGLPLFIVFLTDLGNIIKGVVKLIWLYMRRLYHTGSLWRRRKDPTVNVFQEPQVTGAGDPSQFGNLPEGGVSTTATKFSDNEETLSTQDISTFQEDQEYTLSIPVALFSLTIYIFLGALIYSSWEGWTFFESFYYVFICLSTIGFGDFIPTNPTCQVVTIFYECFGKALTAMCISVFQEKLSESFHSVKSDSIIDNNLDRDSSSGQSFDILDMKAGSSVEQILIMEEKEEAKHGIVRTKSYRSTTFGKIYADVNANPIDVPITVEENKELAVARNQKRPDPNIMATIPASGDI